MAFSATPFQEFDGSDSGARPDEAISWGKIKIDAKPVKVGPRLDLKLHDGTTQITLSACLNSSFFLYQVCADASIIFPLLISQTFMKHWKPREEEGLVQQKEC